MFQVSVKEFGVQDDAAASLYRQRAVY